MKKYIQRYCTIAGLEQKGKPADLPFDEFVSRLKTFYAKYFSKEYIEANLQFTEDFKEYAESMTVSLDGSNESWHDVESILFCLPDFCQRFEYDFFERKKKNVSGEGDILWLILGWSGRHDYAYCCDRGSKHYGKLFDFHDDHPWLEKGDVLYYEGAVYDSILDYFRSRVEYYENN